MKIAYISDIHIEFAIRNNEKMNMSVAKESIDNFISEYIKPLPADVLVIAGDLSHFNWQSKLLLKCLNSLGMYKKIFVVSGNHDMYVVPSEKLSYTEHNSRINELKEFCNSENNIEFLDGNIIEYNGVKFGGCSMWYDFTYGMQMFNQTKEQMLLSWKLHMNDSNYIPNFNTLEFFESEYKKMENIVEECDVFVSHVGPIVPKNIRASFVNSLTGFYYFDGSEILNVDKAPKLWFFGHTHDKFDFNYNNTRLLCNPLGYISERTQHTIKVIEYS